MQTRGGSKWELPSTVKKKHAKKRQRRKHAIKLPSEQQRNESIASRSSVKEGKSKTIAHGGQAEIPNNSGSIVTATEKAIWRQCLKDVTAINIPQATSLRPMKTRNAFVTRAVVLFAYLIVHAEEGKPMPKFSGKFKIDPVKHRTGEMEEEITGSGVDYVDSKLKWNDYGSAKIHIGACKGIGSWLANQLHKARQHGTWKVVGAEVVGSTKGLYEPYRNLLQKAGIDIPVEAGTPVKMAVI